MSKKLTIIHTTLATVSTIPCLISEMYENSFEVVNVMDDSLLNEIKTEGKITKSVINRFVLYSVIAENNGSDAILLACSSIGEAVNVAKKVIRIPVYRIDEPMAQLATELGNRILVLGTVKSTLDPTSKLIESKKKGNQTIDCIQIPNVFELYAVNKELHDQKIAEVINSKINDYDVIVLAQASMSNAISYVKTGKNKILTSLPLGLNQLNELL